MMEENSSRCDSASGGEGQVGVSLQQSEDDLWC